METRKYEKMKAHTKYYNAAGALVPGCTTVLNQLGWNKNALVAWARREALSGQDPEKKKQEAADIGSLAHFMIECHFKGVKPDLSDFTGNQIDKAENCFLAFLEWDKNYKLQCVESEISLVSEKYQFGGTIDFIARPTINAGGLWLMDFKSSKGIYAEAFCQVAAYCHLWQDARHQKIDAVHILKLGKEDGSFEDHMVQPEKLKIAFDVFYHCRALYDLERKLK